MQSQQKFSVGEILQTAWGNLRTEPMALLERAGLPVLLSALVSVVVSLYFPGDLKLDGTTDTSDPAFAEAVAGLLPIVLIGAGISLILIVTFSVAWYRHILIRDPKEAGWLAIRWDSARTNFLFRFVGLALLAIGSAFPAGLLPQLIGLPPVVSFVVMLLVPITIFSRLCLCLPGTAIGDSVTFADSWRMTRGQTMNMAVVAVLSLIPTFVISLVVLTIASTILGMVGVVQTLTATFVLSVLSESIVYTGYGFQAGAIAEAYKRLKSREIE